MNVFPEVAKCDFTWHCVFTDLFLWLENHIYGLYFVIKPTEFESWYFYFWLKATMHKMYCDYWMAGTLQIMNGIKDVEYVQVYCPSKQDVEW